MKKILTLLLLFTLVGFLSGNQVIITNDYQYIVSTGKTYNFNNGNPSNNIKYDRTNKIQIQNNKVIANPLKYHYAFFWQEDNTFIGYYKTNKGLTTSGAYLGQVNTQSIPLPLNAYSFALVRYDNDYVLVNGYTIEELFIDNNLAGVDPADFNDIPIAELNGLTLNEIFNDSNILPKNLNEYTGVSNVIETTSQFIFDTTQAVSATILSNSTGIHYFAVNSQYDSISRFLQVRFRDSLGNDLGIFQIERFLDKNFQSFIQNIQGSVFSIRWLRGGSSSGGLVNIEKDFVLLNLTALGLTSLTKAQLDTYFSIYQNGLNATYYATDGNVSSVDGYYYAAGKNLFDGELELGQYDDITGLKVAFSTRMRNKNLISVNPSTVYSIKINNSYQFGRIYLYDINKNYLGFNFNITAKGSPSGNEIEFETTSDTYYLAFRTLTNQILLDSLVQIEEGSTSTTFEPFAQPTTTLNLTFLFGIGNEPDKATMDGYYQEYEEYLEYLYVCCNIFATQTISFETIYFDDGVSTEIQRLGSILIFTLIGFTLMIFGFVSRRRIFNLLSIGAFIVLGFLLIDFVGFIIILFGLVFINVYYTFFGEL